MISRRQLVAIGAATAAAAGAGVGGVLWSWWEQTPDSEHRFLSTTEAAFLRSLAGTAWPATEQLPLAGEDASLDHYVDGILGSQEPTQRSQIRLLLHALDHAPLPTHGATFQGLDQGGRSEVLQTWMDSELAELRGAVASVVIFLGMGYTTHPRNAPWFSRMYGCGYAR